MFARGVPVSHVRADGSVEPHEAMERRMLGHLHIPDGDLLRSRAECLDEAYRLQGERIAWEDDTMDGTKRQAQ